MSDPHNYLIWEEINLSSLAENIRALKKMTRQDVRFMAVVKADAYGHGAVEAAGTALASGAHMLGVARVEEAVALRRNGISAPVLIFGKTPVPLAPLLPAHDLSATVFDHDMASALSEYGRKNGRKIKIHVKIDTGMGRVGIVAGQGPGLCPDPAVKAVLDIKKLEGVYLEGIYTHFARADETDLSHAREQFRIFSDCLEKIKEAGIDIDMQHSANSAALISLPETHLNLVRPGIAIYGLYPSGEVDRSKIRLKPVLSLKTRVVQIKAVPAGFRVGYGSTFETRQPSVLATVPVGYADGFPRLLSSRADMLVRGKRVRIAGRVCMDQLVLDVTHIRDIALDDEVVIIGTQGRETISADEPAALAHTINYEIVSSILPRVPKIYIR